MRRAEFQPGNTLRWRLEWFTAADSILTTPAAYGVGNARISIIGHTSPAWL
jgi:hypothetical protein